MKFVIYTDKGFVRKHNEDAIFAADNVISGCDMVAPIESNTENHKSSCIFAVIDGIGGYEGGEKAAYIVANSFMENSEDWNIPASEAKNKITSILADASKRIIYAAKNNPELSNMGAVLAGIIFCNENMLIFNCGDCRVYEQRNYHLEKLSHDHSLVQELFDRGEIEENDMRTHLRKNIVTACVSANPSYLNIFFRELPYGNEYKRIFICSDGVWEALSVAELEECLCENSLESANNIVKRFFTLQERCRDNVSFIIIDL